MLMKAGQVSASIFFFFNKHFCLTWLSYFIVSSGLSFFFSNQELRWRLITLRNSTLVMMKRTKGLKKKETTGECLSFLPFTVSCSQLISQAVVRTRVPQSKCTNFFNMNFAPFGLYYKAFFI